MGEDDNSNHFDNDGGDDDSDDSHSDSDDESNKRLKKENRRGKLVQMLLSKSFFVNWFYCNPRRFYPNYTTIIKNPMWLQKIVQKNLNNEYHDWDDIVLDCRLVLKNALIYNNEKPNIIKQ